MNKALLSAVVTLAVLQGACKSQVVQYGEGRYANCDDLGDLAELSTSAADAEALMRARVTELGGDTLLFGVRGRSEQLNETPREIVARRDIVLEGATTVTFEQAADSDEVRPMPTLPAPPTSGEELWYYGAALRCKRASE